MLPTTITPNYSNSPPVVRIVLCHSVRKRKIVAPFSPPVVRFEVRFRVHHCICLLCDSRFGFEFIIASACCAIRGSVSSSSLHLPVVRFEVRYALKRCLHTCDRYRLKKLSGQFQNLLQGPRELRNFVGGKRKGGNTVSCRPPPHPHAAVAPPHRRGKRAPWRHR